MRSSLFKIFIFSIALMIVASSCKFQKLLKSTDNELKLSKAKEYYDKRDFARALDLYEQLIPIYRGTNKSEEISYLYAYCNYYLKDYIMAGHYFRKFTESFPISEHAMECAYLSAYCYYLDAPKPSLDQETTRKAISELELYIIRYPLSDKIAESNQLMDELRARLEKKSFDNAMLYYKLGNFKAAVIALKSSLKEFPDSKFREEMLYHVVKSGYEYASNSIYSKAQERFVSTVKDYKIFVKAYPESKYNKDVSKIYDDITTKLEKFN